MRKAPKVVALGLALTTAVVTLVVLLNKVGWAALQGGGGGFGGGGVGGNIILCLALAFVLSLIVLVLFLVCILTCTVLGKNETCGRVCQISYFVLIFAVILFLFVCISNAGR
ncbi:MAG TPA: hypothetical protein VF588_07380 [Pyrinomonadaceae bacterium]|jgi:hypothetical protein